MLIMKIFHPTVIFKGSNFEDVTAINGASDAIPTDALLSLSNFKIRIRNYICCHACNKSNLNAVFHLN